MVEGARLEIAYTAKPYRGFESLPLRHFHALWGSRNSQKPAIRAQKSAVFWCRCVSLDPTQSHVKCGEEFGEKLR